MSLRQALRLVGLVLTAVSPGPLKRFVYRHVFGYHIGARAKLGLSVIDARHCRIEEGAFIGHGNVFLGVGVLNVGDHVRIGMLNVVRGGDKVELQRYSEIIRLNFLNAIQENDCIGNPTPDFRLGAGSVITSGHRFDFTDRVDIGRHTIIGGRGSSFWTHNRQRTKPIVIGDFVYLGSDVRAAPGATVPSHCIVGIGSVLIGRLVGERSLISGFPAVAVRPLTKDDEELLNYRTRPDLPDDLRARPD